MSHRRIAVALALIASAALGQSPEQHLTEAVSVGYVMVPFTVLDPRGAPITDLRARDVKLLVDGAAVSSDMFEKSQDAPVSWTILLDGSGSMALGGKLDAARAAVDALVARRKAGDDFALWVFADDEAKEVVPFTQDTAAITRAMRSVRPYAKTAFFDALSTMPERSRLGRNPTRAIILLSDGIDNASKLTRDELAHLLEGVAIPIYPLGLRDASDATVLASGKMKEELSDLTLLDAVARLTGGRMFVGIENEQLARAAEAIDRNLRAQYLIGFSPTGRGAVKYRQISLQFAGRVRSVRVRAGYVGTEPPMASVSMPPTKSKRNERKGS